MTDLIFLLGAGLLALTFPLTVGAFSSSGKSMRPVLLCVLLGGGCLVYAMSASPGGYDAASLPEVVKRVFHAYVG